MVVLEDESRNHHEDSSSADHKQVQHLASWNKHVKKYKVQYVKIHFNVRKESVYI